MIQQALDEAGLTRLWSKVKALVSSSKQISWQEITLMTSGWSSSTKQQTVTVSGITVSGDGLVEPMPKAGDSQTLWQDNGVKALPLTADNRLTFQCDSIPSAAMSIVVKITK